MLDLVINHTAVDSPLTYEHPEWYAKDEDGRIKNPSCIDPADATQITVWGDLAELAYWPPPDPEGLLHYWDQVVSYYLRLGFTGFRADAAYKIPGDFWARLITEARALDPEVQFFAETLGCRIKELDQLSSAGFDFIYNSSKWWDFKEDWCLSNTTATGAWPPPSASRRPTTPNGWPGKAKGPWKWPGSATCLRPSFSTGLMMPAGFEFGFQQKAACGQYPALGLGKSHL
jgi:starch synthase (maltosyl-transferring)